MSTTLWVAIAFVCFLVVLGDRIRFSRLSREKREQLYSRRPSKRPRDPRRYLRQRLFPAWVAMTVVGVVIVGLVVFEPETQKHARHVVVAVLVMVAFLLIFMAIGWLAYRQAVIDQDPPANGQEAAPW